MNRSETARDSRPLVVVGGGLAGMAACAEAARAGLDCTLIDEAPDLGGQIYRATPANFRRKESHHKHGEDAVQARGDSLRAEIAAQAAKVEHLAGMAVVGIWNKRELLLAASDEVASATGAPNSLKADRLILACGAYERSIPFPGWTLPGVMTAGGAQTFVKTMQVRPGSKALVAGTGPLLLVVATHLLRAGIHVHAVLEAGRLSSNPFKIIPAVWGNWELLAEARRYLQQLHNAGVPVLRNHTVFRAEGDDRVQAVHYGPVDPAQWKPRVDQVRHVEVDLLVVGYGFIPNTELSVLAGCGHIYREELGGWVPERDTFMRTSLPGVYAAGDGAGVAGALVAAEQGRVAGITAAQDAAALSSSEADRRRAAPFAKLARLARLRALLDESSLPRAGLVDLVEPDTLVCRCEEIAWAEVRKALSEGARNLHAVKLFTRLGMGPCQGRMCGPSAAQCMARELDRPPGEMGRINPRPPVRPITLGSLAAACKGDNQ